VKFVHAPSTILAGLAENEEIDGRLLATNTANELRVAETFPPLVSFTVTVTLYEPATVGVQVTIWMVDAVHPRPVGEEVQTNVSPPEPPAPVAVKVIACPTVPTETDEEGVVTVGKA
jgi:hypothetical protein